MDRTILHCDCNSFFASVECAQEPRLWLVPMAVCGDPESRHGIILAKNELAKGFGVTTAETVWSARKKCPDLVLVPARHGLYGEYSRRINRIYGQYTDQVEAFSIDESWLDVTGSRKLFGTGPEIADTLRARVRRELGITISVGVSFNKIFAKMGSDYRKPDATTVITRENYRDILYPLPVGELLMAGPAAVERLSRVGVKTIGQLAAFDRPTLERLLGKLGGVLWDYANALEDSPVRVQGAETAAKSVSHAITFRRNLMGEEDIRQGLLLLTDTVAARLRAQGLRCTTLSVAIKDPGLATISRQRTLRTPTHETRRLFETALALVRENWNLRAPIRLLSVAATGLVAGEGQQQLELFGDGGEADLRRQRLDSAVDAIRRRYGEGALRHASLMKSDILARPEDPDKE